MQRSRPNSNCATCCTARLCMCLLAPSPHVLFCLCPQQTVDERKSAGQGSSSAPMPACMQHALKSRAHAALNMNICVPRMLALFACPLQPSTTCLLKQTCPAHARAPADPLPLLGASSAEPLRPAAQLPPFSAAAAHFLLLFTAANKRCSISKASCVSSSSCCFASSSCCKADTCVSF